MHPRERSELVILVTILNTLNLTDFVSMAFYIILTDFSGCHYSHGQPASQTLGRFLALFFHNIPGFPLEVPPCPPSTQPSPAPCPVR